MAEKQFALGGSRGVGFVEDDDPLAELARIVGFQEQPAVQVRQSGEGESISREAVLAELPPVSISAQTASAQQPNPVGDLEDELLRAFEVYDAPRGNAPSAPVPDVRPVAPVVAHAMSVPAARIEPAFGAAAPDENDDPFAALAAVVAAEPISERRVMAPPPAPPASFVAEPEFSMAGLEEELMESLNEAALAIPAPAPVQAPAPVVSAPVTFTPSLTQANMVPRVQRTNFPLQASVRSEPVMEKPVLTPAPEPEEQASIAWDLPGYGVETDQAPAVEMPRASAPEISLLDDVSRYDQPLQKAEAGRREPDFDSAFSALDAVASSPAPVAKPDMDDVFNNAEFELDFADIEAELSNIAFEDEPVVAAPKAEVLTRFAPESERRAVASAEPYFAVRDPEPVKIVEVPAAHRTPEAQSVAPVEPIAASPVFAAAPDASTFGDVNGPFDPTQFFESEEGVEALAELDVPEIPEHVEDEPAVVVPDYDLDIDAEMASLFEKPVARAPEPVSAPKAAEQPVKPVAANWAREGSQPVQKKVQIETFDEFERALEDDFRSMLSQPLKPAQAGSPVPQPLSGNRGLDRGTFRSILMAAAATGVVAVVGLGGYMYFKDGGSVIGSGEPRIIAADKGPVKVVPENKGGVTVPNQDKAVYDRVAGKEAETVKQSTLVTTEEEPLDVVQKTLVPENTIDAEAEQPPIATPVEDTRDARLLPADGEAQSPGTDAEGNAPGGVAVRKVRTMIVKADGTLVPREDPAPEAQTQGTQVAAAVPAPSAAPIGAPTPDTDLRSQTENAAATTGQTPAPVPAPVETAAAAPDQPASAEALATVANSDVPVTAPVRTVKTTAVSDKAPIPTARPSDQPVNVVGAVTENGNIRPVETPKQTASIDTAAAAPAPASGSYGMQISSLPSEADAKATIPRMASKFGSVLGGRSISIRKADIPGKGTFYRLRVDVGSKADAIALCSKLKAAGGTCLVSK